MTPRAFLPPLALLAFALALPLATATDSSSIKPAPAEPASHHAPPPPLAHATLAPALKAAAKRDGIRVFHYDSPGPDARTGDTTVAWIGAHDGKVTRQWLVAFRRGTTTAAEQKSERQDDETKYLSWGPVITFKSDTQALDLWIAGPVVISPEPAPDDAPAIARIKRRRIFVPADYLQLGLDNSLRVEEHIRRRTLSLQQADPNFQPGHLYSLEKPIAPDSIARAKPIAEKIGFTPEMERAWSGGFVALNAFYEIANDVPEIEAIARTALDKPRFWELVKMIAGTGFKTFLGGPTTESIDPAKIGLLPVSTETFDAPFLFQFGDDPIVSGRLVVSTPTPPFDTSAGVLALLAYHPKDPRHAVHVITISALRGPAE